MWLNDVRLHRFFNLLKIFSKAAYNYLKTKIKNLCESLVLACLFV